ncbi:MAG: hypothetical protein R3343_06730 [Nitriliruptorales bacterium]|nr:hypothetical protein [Nitriliruptorales bacterium]
MFESKALKRLSEALQAVVELGPTLEEMVAEIRSMREVMVQTNRALEDVTTSMDATRDKLDAMSEDVARASGIIEQAHHSLEAATQPAEAGA